MNQDTLLAGVLFIGACLYLIQKRVPTMIAWVVVVYLLATELCDTTQIVGVIAGVLIVFVFSSITYNTWEGFEGEKKEKAPEPAPPKTADPHVDIGTTILHAYRNLSPEQIGGMRRDTKELMELQKELMGSLSEMKPAIEQGAELLRTFSQFFGKNE